jgi:hypothetical protein
MCRRILYDAPLRWNHLEHEDWIWKPTVSWFELFDFSPLKAGLLYNMFGSF